MNFSKIFGYLLFLFLFYNCATNKLQVTEKEFNSSKKDTSKIIHSFYLMGDAGNSELGKKDAALAYLEKEIQKNRDDIAHNRQDIALIYERLKGR